MSRLISHFESGDDRQPIKTLDLRRLFNDQSILFLSQNFYFFERDGSVLNKESANGKVYIETNKFRRFQQTITSILTTKLITFPMHPKVQKQTVEIHKLRQTTYKL